MISRQAGSRQCLLDSACPGGERLLRRGLVTNAFVVVSSSSERNATALSLGSAPPTLKAVQRRHGNVPYRSGAVTMFAQQCRPAPQWSHVPYILAAEGTHLDLIREASPERCKAVCEVTAGCNAVRWRWFKNQAECHLKAQCTQPDSVAAQTKSKTPPLKQRPYVTEFKWPCTAEAAFFPSPGLRRTLPPDEPTRLLSFDCAAPPNNASCCAHLRAEVARTPPHAWPDVTALRWPSFYRAPSQLLIRPPARREARGQRRWQGADAQLLCSETPTPRECPLAPLDRVDEAAEAMAQEERAAARGGRRGEGGRRRRHKGRGRSTRVEARAAAAEAAEAPHADTLFVRVARRVAARSFNGKEVVLAVSDGGGLPMFINMVASLAQHGHQHVLLLANEPATCALLRSDAAPACLWSSLLRRYHKRLRVYNVQPSSVQLLWLQRWYYVRRYAGLRLEPLTSGSAAALLRTRFGPRIGTASCWRG